RMGVGNRSPRGVAAMPDNNNAQKATAPERPEVSSRPLTPAEQQQSEDLHWAATAPEVQQHLGKFVVVRKKRVIAVGTDRRALVEQAAAQEGCGWWELAVEVVPPAEVWEVPIGAGATAPTENEEPQRTVPEKVSRSARPLTGTEQQQSEDL